MYKKVLYNIIKNAYLFTAITVIILLISNLAIPYAGYVALGGESMDPTIPAGCNIASAESWNGESNLQDKVVAYKHQYKNEDEYRYQILNSNIEISFDWYAHRVVAEYEEYNMNKSDYYIKENGLFVDNSTDRKISIIGNQPYESAKELEGKHVIILAGDYSGLDAEIVPVENVYGIIDETNTVQIQSLNTWPCSILK